MIGISIDLGEINSLDDKVLKYLDYFNDERSEITLRDLLDMSSGLDFPSHEHEKMFFHQKSHKNGQKFFFLHKVIKTAKKYFSTKKHKSGQKVFFSSQKS